MPSLADRVDAVIGVDTHRDTHEVEIADANGTPIATCSISNDSSGFAGLIAWIAELICPAFIGHGRLRSYAAAR
jgi:transposase